jgi:hypothetical protein
MHVRTTCIEKPDFYARFRVLAGFSRVFERVKDAGGDSELDDTEPSSWPLFLKTSPHTSTPPRFPPDADLSTP